MIPALAPPNPALPLIDDPPQDEFANFTLCVSSDDRVVGIVWGSGSRIVGDFSTPRGFGPSGEAPLPALAYPEDYMVSLDVPIDELRERLSGWRR